VTEELRTLEPDAYKIPSLDGARGLAVLLVMLYHFSPFLAQARELGLLESAFAFGWSGVDLFFCLSGFLITGVLLSSKGASNYFTAFYARRFLRIFPIYYLVIGLALTVTIACPAARASLPQRFEMPWYAAFASNWLPVLTDRPPRNSLGHLWSLAIEEQFYLVWPAVVLFCDARRLKMVALAGVATSVFLRLFTHFYLGAEVGPIYSTFTRCDGLLLGAFCAVLFREVGDPKKLQLGRWILIPAVAFFALLIALPKQKIWFFGLGITLLSISYAALILQLALSDRRPTALQRFFTHPALRTVGRYSYGMYVYHVPILALTAAFIISPQSTLFNEHPALALAVTVGMIATTFGIAALSFRFFEEPILSFKRYLRSREPEASLAVQAVPLGE
jgi:peptidoglycan/LPS O-acetylase OafA/YrhL